MVGTGCGRISITLYTQGLFFAPVTEEFGWNQSEFFTSYTVLMLLSVVTGPVVGNLITRYGVRNVGLAGLAGHGVGYLHLAINPGSLALWFVSHGLLSVLAAGSLPITWTALVSRYFSTRLGLAIGITMSGTGVAAALAQLYVRFRLEAFGWRMTYANLGTDRLGPSAADRSASAPSAYARRAMSLAMLIKRASSGFGLQTAQSLNSRGHFVQAGMRDVSQRNAQG